MNILDIKTKQVYIREIKESDMEDLTEYLTDGYTMRFFDHGVLDTHGIKTLIEKKDVIYGIVHRKTNKLIGHFVYHNWFMRDTYEIGWVLNKDYHNQGIISNLAKEFMHYAFTVDKAHRIVATCQPENIASNKVCEHLGLRLEGTFLKCIYVERLDEWWDELFYALLENEYLEKENGHGKN